MSLFSYLGDSNSLGLILGLSLGLGIPALVIIIGLIYKSRRKRRNQFNIHNENNDDIPMKGADDRSESFSFQRYIY
jgi:hypothetical protein